MSKNKRNLEEPENGERAEKRVKVEEEMGVVTTKEAPPPTKNAFNTTLYVSSLPPTLSSSQLSSLFSSFAPVRSAFVVSTSTQKQESKTNEGDEEVEKVVEKKSRGFGYVKFVLKDDAERCIEEWSKGIPQDAVEQVEEWTGSREVLKRIKVTLAKQKPTLEERKKKQVTVVDDAKVQEKSDSVRWKERRQRDKESKLKVEQLRKDQDASRIVVLLGFGLGSGLGSRLIAPDLRSNEEELDKHADDKGDSTSDSKAIQDLYKKARKLGTVEDVRYPVYFSAIHRFISTDPTVEIRYATPHDAQYAVSKLHNHIFKGFVVSACVKSEWDKVSRERIDERRSNVDDKERPEVPAESKSGRLIVRNLPFNINKSDLISVFSQYGSIHSVTLPTKSTDSEEASGYAFVHYTHYFCAQTAIEKVNGTRIYAGCAQERVLESQQAMGKKGRDRKKEIQSARDGRGREVAVDWAVGKTKWKELQKRKCVDGEGVAENEDMMDHAEDLEKEEEDEDSDLDPITLDDEDNEEDDEEEKSPKVHEEKGFTLFVRNLSFETKEEELYDLFKSFGPLRYARIAMDSTKNRSRGTGFVCFWNKDDAEEVLKLSETLQREWKIEGDQVEKGKKTQRSILQPDLNSNIASRLSLGGRVLGVSHAVSREKADELREDRDKQNKKTDRRNLYLMKEGVIHSAHPLVKSLTAADIQARQTSFDTRKNLLRSNPSLYISKTRLSVRQIPIWVTDSLLKRLSLWALKEFDKEVKSGTREGITVEDDEDKTEVRVNKKGIPLSKVVQSKICRQSDRLDATNPIASKSTIGKSKGYAFLEMNNHLNAMKVLQYLNGNKAAEKVLREWWKEDLKKKLDALKEKKADKQEIERAEVALQRWDGKSGSKTLMLEFSIENTITNKRRQEKRERIVQQVNAVKPLRRENKEGSRPDKKVLPMKSKKKGELVGGLIGRKRKERKAKKI